MNVCLVTVLVRADRISAAAFTCQFAGVSTAIVGFDYFVGGATATAPRVDVKCGLSTCERVGVDQRARVLGASADVGAADRVQVRIARFV